MHVSLHVLGEQQQFIHLEVIDRLLGLQTMGA